MPPKAYLQNVKNYVYKSMFFTIIQYKKGGYSMHRNTLKKNLIAFFFLAICFALSVFVLFLTIHSLPKAVKYTAKSDDENAFAKDESYVLHEEILPKYKSVYEIESDGPFQIRLEGENIFVFQDESVLYRIKTSGNTLSQSDLEKIGSVYEFQSKSELIEKVEYMES